MNTELIRLSRVVQLSFIILTTGKEALVKIPKFISVHLNATTIHARIAKEIIVSWQRQSALSAGRALAG
jgi:hypothetical protein